jgi:hypothetical protein
MVARARMAHREVQETSQEWRSPKDMSCVFDYSRRREDGEHDADSVTVTSNISSAMFAEVLKEEIEVTFIRQ